MAEEKKVLIPLSVIESILNNPGNREVLAQLRRITEDQGHISTHREIKKEGKE